MSKFILLVFLTIISLYSSAYAQTFDNFYRSADSARKNNDYKTAAKDYGSAIEIILSGKELVNNNIWSELLLSAADAESNSRNIHRAQVYWNMRYGSHGEKLDDKIIRLKKLGIKHIFTFRAFNLGFSTILTINRCSSNLTKYLFWIENQNLIVQKFDECDTYKSFELGSVALAKFYTRNSQKITTESIVHFGAKVDHLDEFLFEFYIAGTVVPKRFNQERDLVNPNYTQIQVEEQSYKKDLKLYKSNIKTKLSQLLPMAQTEVKNYEKLLTSADEKRKVGSI